MRVLYVKNGSDRDKRFQLQTMIYEVDGKKFVKKSALCDEALPHLFAMKENYTKLTNAISNPKVKLAKIVAEDDRSLTFEYIDGISLEKKFQKIKSDKEKVSRFIDEYSEFLKSSFKTKKFDVETITDECREVFGDFDYSSLVGELCFDSISNIDLIFSNIIYRDDEIYIIDYEWVFEVSLPINYMLYRTLEYKTLLKEYEYFIKYKDLENFFINKYVYNKSFHKYNFKYDKKRIILEEEIREKNQQIQEKEQQLQKLETTLNHIEEHKNSVIQELESVYSSKRWKLFYPIDKFKEKELSKKMYVFIKSNRALRTVYHKLPMSNELRWKIRQFVSTGKIQKDGTTSLVEDDLNILKNDVVNCEEFPLVSVIIPCYNQGCYLWESVASAYASYSSDIEVIVVDDGSTDTKTIKCMREIKSFFPNVEIIHKENGGLSSARNVGIKKAKGTYIQFLDADDILVPGKIDIQVSMAKDTNSVMISNYLTCDESCKAFYKTEETIKGFSYTFDDFIFKWERGLSIPIHCGLFPKKIFDEIKFDTELSAKEDWFMWVTLVNKGYKIKYLDIHSSVYRMHDKSMVRQSFVKMSQQWEKAYTKIASLLDGEKKIEFVKESKKWLENYYRSNPNYKEEVKKKDKIVKNQESSKTLNIDEEATIQLIKNFKNFGDNHPVISVVVPVFNHYEYLFSCFESVTKQGNVPIELICVNDNSSDKRVANLLDKLGSCSNVTIIQHKENKGISYTQNEAVDVANGQYIAFLDCDDFLKEGALEIVYEQIKELSEVDYFFTDRTNIDQNDKILYDATYKVVQSTHGIKDDLLDRMIASHLKVIKKSTYIDVGGSDAKMSGIQDWDLALKIAEVGELDYIDESLYCHRLHENSVTSSDSVAQYKKTNILRREFLEKWLNREENTKDIWSLLKSDNCNVDTLNELDNFMVFSPQNIKLNTWYCPDEIQEAFRSGKIIVFDAQDMMDNTYIEFLRDFNSYFDLIICDRLSVSSKLIGVTWSENIIWTPLKL
jgi:glycosyltransferase involved in cell wall biosynthesis